VPIQIATECGI